MSTTALPDSVRTPIPCQHIGIPLGVDGATSGAKPCAGWQRNDTFTNGLGQNCPGETGAASGAYAIVKSLIS